MQKRKANFYAGPSALPYPVLLKLEKSIVDYRKMGLSLIETRRENYPGLRAALLGAQSHDCVRRHTHGFCDLFQ